MNKKLSDKYVAQLKEYATTGDNEHDHLLADNILCSILWDLGYKEVVTIYNSVGKWYS